MFTNVYRRINVWWRSLFVKTAPSKLSLEWLLKIDPFGPELPSIVLLLDVTSPAYLTWYVNSVLDIFDGRDYEILIYETQAHFLFPHLKQDSPEYAGLLAALQGWGEGEVILFDD